MKVITSGADELDSVTSGSAIVKPSTKTVSSIPVFTMTFPSEAPINNEAVLLLFPKLIHPKILKSLG